MIMLCLWLSLKEFFVLNILNMNISFIVDDVIF